MKLSQYGYDFSADMLAKYPATNRDDSRLMVVNRKNGSIEHRIFKDIIDYFDEKDIFVFNDTKVFPARLYGNKEKTGAEIGYEFNYPFNENTSFISEGYYRHFFSYSQKEPTDFEYRLKARNRIETKLTGDLYLAPFYDYELAKTRGAHKSRAQSTFGLSLSYNKSFDLLK